MLNPEAPELTYGEYMALQRSQQDFYDAAKTGQVFDCRKMLPPLFANVIALGVRDRENVMPQWYEARRWTGCNFAADKQQTAWEWLTPCDGVIKDVTHWFKIPSTAKPHKTARDAEKEHACNAAPSSGA